MPPAEADAPRRGCVGRGLTSPEPCASAGRGAAYGTDGAHGRDEGSAGGVALETLRTAWQGRASLSRSFAFRIALTFWFLFMTCFGLAGVFFYQTLQERVLERTEAVIVEKVNGIRAVYRTEGIDAVIRIARRRDAMPMQTSMGLHLSKGGQRIAGNVPLLPAEKGWDTLPGDVLGLDGDTERYRFLTTTLGEHDLSVGHSLRSLRELRAVSLPRMLWAMGVATLLAFVAATWIARRMQRRMGVLRGAIDRVAAGDLDARIPLSGRCDDVDAMSEAVNAALERLSRSVEGMRQVSTDIAHDLKTPLNRLWIQIDEAVAKSRAGHCVGEELELALEEARGIDATFEALLRIAQIEAGARRARFAPFDLGEALDDVVEIYEPVIEEEGQTLSLERVPATPLVLHGDRELFTQLVVNLVENASRHGGDRVAIRVSADVEDDRVRLVVADDGPGVPAADRERVLRRLHRLERSRTTRGSGLGLSMVAAVVELHGGEIALEDNAPGLRVTVRFPSSDVDATPA